MSPQEPPGWTLVLPFHKEVLCYSKQVGWGVGGCGLLSKELLQTAFCDLQNQASVNGSILQMGTVSPKGRSNLFQPTVLGGMGSEHNLGLVMGPPSLGDTPSSKAPLGDRGDVLPCKASGHRLHDMRPRGPRALGAAGRRLVPWARLGRKTICSPEKAPGTWGTAGFPEAAPARPQVLLGDVRGEDGFGGGGRGS